MTTYRIIEAEEQPYLYVAKTVEMNPEAISQAMGQAFHTVMAFAASKQIALNGPPLSAYYSYDPNDMDFRSGFIVSDADRAKADGEVQADVLPAGRVLTCTHIGPYAALGDTYKAMMAYVREQGLSLAVPTWEMYVNDPADTPEDELRTEIFARLA